MTTATRVVHLPARTPYTRKITAPGITILNETATPHGVVPAAVTAKWLLQRLPLDWFDVLHLHHVDFEEPTNLERLLAACGEAGIRVVFTAHDVSPMVGTNEDFDTRLKLVSQYEASWVGLTAGSCEVLNRRIPGLPQISVIPHGYSIAPERLAANDTALDPGPYPHYLIFGALRPSRDHLSTVANWSLGLNDPEARLSLMLRGLSPADFERYNVPALLALARSDPRISTSMKSYPTDEDITAAGLHVDALLLPYLAGSHSGQLELAFDLNLLPVCSSVGHLREQFALVAGLVDEPVWFDWSDESPHLFGERFLAALETSYSQLKGRPRRTPDPAFLDYRRDEHSRFLDAYKALYAH